MKLRISAALACLVTLSGCAGIDAARQYNDVDPVSMTVHDHDWRIFDKPKESRMMVTPSIGRSFAAGLPGGDIPKPQYAAAAEAWLAKNHAGKTCTIVDGYVILQPQWEFTYKCA